MQSIYRSLSYPVRSLKQRIFQELIRLFVCFKCFELSGRISDKWKGYTDTQTKIIEQLRFWKGMRKCQSNYHAWYNHRHPFRIPRSSSIFPTEKLIWPFLWNLGCPFMAVQIKRYLKYGGNVDYLIFEDWVCVWVCVCKCVCVCMCEKRKWVKDSKITNRWNIAGRVFGLIFSKTKE